MTTQELTDEHFPKLSRGEVCVLLVAETFDQRLHDCLDTLLSTSPSDLPVVIAAGPRAEPLHLRIGRDADRRRIWLSASARTDAADTSAGAPDQLTATVQHALSRLSPADVVVLSEPCLLSEGCLDRLHDAAYADTNTASASALADFATDLALGGHASPKIASAAATVAANSLALRPRLNVCVGPCIYLRRDALQLVGSLDTALQLRAALGLDYARRCLLSGLAHVAADDVLVGALPQMRPPVGEVQQGLSGANRKLVPETVRVAASGVLPRALEAARRPHSRLWVTIDVRALNATLTGTQRYILELIRALAATERLQLRLLVAADTDAQLLEALRAMPHAGLLTAESIDETTPRSPVFHRPQQVFGPPDIRLALRLGERIVLNQLDLIAYRNPSYHANGAAWHSHRRASRQALAAADRVVVFSDHTRMELLSDELVEDERVRIVPPGLDHNATTEPVFPTALGAFLGSGVDGGATPRDFLLCLGTDFRHKNRPFALRLLAALRERHGWQGRLVLAGTHIPHGSSRKLERELLERNPRLDEDVIDLGVVQEAEKLWLMRNATAVVYPSAYEGFGLVPFEAGLCGTPCLFAARSSLAEVLPGGSAAIVPWSATDSADRAHELLTDGSARTAHVQALAASARDLTWQATAAALVELYEEAAVAGGREAAELSRDELEREQEVRQLVAEQDALVAQLASERDHAREMYDSLNTEVGSGLSLIGPNGALPANVQNGLLALSARPAVARPLLGAVAGVFRALRAVRRRTRS